MATAVAVFIAFAASVGVSSTAGATPTVTRTAAQAAGAGARAAGCTNAHGTHRAHCYLAVAPANAPRASARSTTTCAVDESAGYTPCNLQAAYGLTKLSASHGKGVTVAVVDPNDDPSAEADLGVYRATYGLPKCTTKNGCFRKVDQDGVQGSYPAADPGDAQEIALDIDMVSAVCPHCHILLVEADSNGFGDLGTAENEAVTLGAKVVSNSWGTGEFDGETGWDGDWDHPGVAITFSSGDAAYGGGVQYPSASPYVTSVGGTELTPATTTRGWTEAAWVTPGRPITQGSGSGCSAYEPKPAWQTDAGCANRMTADVSAVAADVLSYDTYGSGGWVYEFGTSVSSPITAALYGLANNPGGAAIPASAAYAARATTRHDITKGKTGACSPLYFCKAAKGYDGPTGLGSPHGIGEFVVPYVAPPTIDGVAFTGPTSAPTVTISGSNLGATAPTGSAINCFGGDTGDTFGSTGLWFADTNASWTAGQAGDCIGIVLQSWSTTQVVFQLGNGYDHYQPIAHGDAIEVEAEGTTFGGFLP
ncbi:MAG TPA: peptidase S8 [Acidimicrobiia bacterium]|nr:peptidase S8 [Acidimicrobiia bacterium]